MSEMKLAHTLVLALALLTAIVPAVAHRRLDAHNWPVIVTPADSTLSANEATSVTVSMNQAGTSPTVVSLSSSHPSLLAVPSTVTVATNASSAVFSAGVYDINPRAKARQTSTVVTVTASANGHSASTTITVD